MMNYAWYKFLIFLLMTKVKHILKHKVCRA